MLPVTLAANVLCREFYACCSALPERKRSLRRRLPQFDPRVLRAFEALVAKVQLDFEALDSRVRQQHAEYLAQEASRKQARMLKAQAARDERQRVAEQRSMIRAAESCEQVRKPMQRYACADMFCMTAV